MPNEPEAADVLDRMANPHPRMWAEARQFYAAREEDPRSWEVCLRMMCAATGYEATYFATAPTPGAQDAS